MRCRLQDKCTFCTGQQHVLGPWQVWQKCTAHGCFPIRAARVGWSATGMHCHIESRTARVQLGSCLRFQHCFKLQCLGCATCSIACLLCLGIEYGGPQLCTMCVLSCIGCDNLYSVVFSICQQTLVQQVDSARRQCHCLCLLHNSIKRMDMCHTYMAHFVTQRYMPTARSS